MVSSAEMCRMWSYRLLRQLSQINTHPNITRPQVIRSSQVLSLESVGSTIIARKSFSVGPKLPHPQSHPADQPVPGPAGRVPINWQALLHG